MQAVQQAPVAFEQGVVSAPAALRLPVHETRIGSGSHGTVAPLARMCTG